MIKIGVIISKYQHCICASSDGIVLNSDNISKILEIKCPITCKNIAILNLELGKCNVSYLQLQHGRVELKKSHIYYTQCQMQIYVAGVKQCDIFVYSPVKNGSCCVQVIRDEKFLETVVKKCENFYFQEYLPILHETVTNENTKKSDNQNKDFNGRDISNII